MTEVHIVGMGGICATGSCTTVSTSAALAGLSRIELGEMDDNTEAHYARVASLDYELSPLEAAQRLLFAALSECTSVFRDEEPALPLYLATSLAVDVRGGSAKLPARWSDVWQEAGGHAAGLRCLERAIAALHAASVGLACIAGVDVQCDSASLRNLHAEGRALTEDNPWGFVPGDGAAAILIATTDACKSLKLQSFGTVRACRSEEEPAAQTNVPCTGAVLTRVGRGVLARLVEGTRVDAIYCDLNGERSRTDEWGFTAPRLSRFCRDVSRVVAPALAWGDLGSASSLMLIQLAVADFARCGLETKRAFVWAASEGGLRGSALLETGAGGGRSWPIPPGRRRAEESAHDSGVMREFLSEGGFLFEQRAHYQRLQDAEPASETHRAAVERTEARLEAHVQGLICGGHLAHELCSTAGEECGEIYLVVRTLLATSTAEQLLEYLQDMREIAPAQREAVAAALSHGASDAGQRHVSLLSNWDAALGLQLAAECGVAPARSWAELSGYGPQALGSSYPLAVASLQPHNAVELLTPWLESDSVAYQELAALASLRVSPESARAYLWERRSRSSFARALACSATLDQLVATQDAVLRVDNEETRCRALGMLGTGPAVTCLLDLLGTVPQTAGEALHLISGAELFEETVSETVVDDASLTHGELAARRAGDAEVGVERARKRVFSRDPARWRHACTSLLQGGAETERWRMGAPISAQRVLEAVTHPFLSATTRNACVEELAIRFRSELPLRSDPRIWDRRRDALAAGGSR